jgi:type VI secretion system Hcp family effector
MTLQFSRRTVVAIGLALAMALGFLASIAISDLRADEHDEEIHACTFRNNVRIVDDPVECRGNEEHISWNVQGPAGPQGSAGPEGPQGPPGATDVNINVTDDRSISTGVHGFIKFDDLVGDANAEKFKGWSRISSVDKALHVPVDSQTGMPVGVAQFSNIEVVKALDTLSPILGEALINGQMFHDVEIVLVDNSQGDSRPYLHYRFENVQIVDVEWSGSVPVDEARPSENLSLAFGKAEVSYLPQEEDAPPVTRSWERGGVQP